MVFFNFAENAKLLLLAVGLFGVYHVLSIEWFSRESRASLWFLRPSIQYLLVILLALDTAMAFASFRFISATGAGFFTVLTFGLASEEWKNTERRWKNAVSRNAQRRTKTVNVVGQVWMMFKQWWATYRKWQEQREVRKLVALEKAKLIAQRELDAAEAKFSDSHEESSAK